MLQPVGIIVSTQLLHVDGVFVLKTKLANTSVRKKYANMMKDSLNVGLGVIPVNAAFNNTVVDAYFAQKVLERCAQ